MITAFRKKVTVRANGKIEIKAKDLKPGTKAEVIVLVEGANAERQKRIVSPSHRGHFHQSPENQIYIKFSPNPVATHERKFRLYNHDRGAVC